MNKNDLILYGYDNNNVKLDNKDKLILYELSTDARQPNSEIGKKIKLSKQSVAKRIEILEKTGVITDYFIWISTLNIPVDYIIFIKLNNDLSDEDIQNKIFQIEGISAIWWCLPHYDIKIIITTPYADELNNKINKITEILESYIKRKTIIKCLNYLYAFDRSYLLNKNNKNHIINKNIPLKLDFNDQAIIKELFNNARIKIIDLAKIVDLSPETVSHKIKTLIKKGIISKPSVGIDLTKIGYTSIELLFSVNGNIEIIEKKILKICRENNNIVFLSKVLGDYNYIISLEIEYLNTLINVINLMKKELGKELNDYTINITYKGVISKTNRKNRIKSVVEYFSSK